MKHGFTLPFFFLAGLSCIRLSAADDTRETTPAKDSVSLWETISYPSMTPWRKSITLPVLRPTIQVENKGKAGMELTFVYFRPTEAAQEQNGKVDAETVTAALHRNEKLPVTLKGVVESHEIGGLETKHSFAIPWGPNEFDDAWVRLDLKDRTFWVEMPYGFTRKPDDPPAPADTQRADPVTTPFKKNGMGPDDLVIPWEYVSYRWQGVKGAGNVTIRLGNSFDAMTELILWRFEGSDVREPHCSVTNVIKPGYEKAGQCISLSLEKSSTPSRSQMFRFTRGSDESRHWCDVQVSVGKEKHTLMVPSSLICYGHGHVSLSANLPCVKIAEKWWSRL